MSHTRATPRDWRLWTIVNSCQTSDEISASLENLNEFSGPNGQCSIAGNRFLPSDVSATRQVAIYKACRRCGLYQDDFGAVNTFSSARSLGYKTLMNVWEWLRFGGRIHEPDGRSRRGISYGRPDSGQRTSEGTFQDRQWRSIRIIFPAVSLFFLLFSLSFLFKFLPQIILVTQISL